MAWTFACVVLGVFMVIHATHQASAIGCSVCDGSPRSGRRAAMSVLVAFIVFLVPLARNAIAAARQLVSFCRKPSRSALRPTFDTLVVGAGVGALGFVVLHALELRSGALSTPYDGGAVQTRLAADLSSTMGGLPLYAIAYLVGAACACVFVFGGLGARLAAGLATARPAVRRLATASMAVAGAVLWASFANAVVFHATGSPLVGRTSPADAGQCR